MSKTDLSSLFRAARAAPGQWTHEAVWDSLRRLADTGCLIDWEPGDEEWGRVLDAEGGIIGLVCARIPLGAVREDVSTQRLPAGIAWFRFRSADEPEFEVDKPLLEGVFGRVLSGNVDYSALSLNNLWWATVS